MIKIKKTLAIILLSIVAIKSSAQVDPHFSQYYMYPLWLNPALTGAIDGNYRVSVIDRKQWGNIGNGFSTVGLSADITTDKNISFGLNLLQQSAGTAGYKYTNAQLSIAYSGIRLGREGDKVITFALQGGMIGRRFDFSSAQVNDQYQNDTYNPALPVDESTAKPSATSFDMSMGAMYYDADVDKKVNLFGGFSAAHITSPKDPSLSVAYNSTLPVRYSLHGGANIYLSEKAHLVPNALYMWQGNVSEAMLGGYVQMAATPIVDISAGINYRVNDAIYPYLGISYDGFTFGFSYDANTSKLGTLAGGAANSTEITLMYMDHKKQKDYFKCPRF